MKVYVCTEFEGKEEWGPTLVCVAEDKGSASEQMEKFMTDKGFPQKFPGNSFWELDINIPQVTFICPRT